MPGGGGVSLLENSQHDSSIKAKGRIEIINAGFYSFSFFFSRPCIFYRAQSDGDNAYKSFSVTGNRCK